MLLAPPRAHNRADSIHDLRRRWHEQARDIQHPDFELTAEDFAGILSTYKLLRAAGDVTEPMLDALMLVLERQAAETFDGFEDDTDTDEDADDEREWDLPRMGPAENGPAMKTNPKHLTSKREEAIIRPHPRQFRLLLKRLSDPFVVALAAGNCLLSPQYQKIGIERHLLGYTLPELAERNGMPTSEVRQVLVFLCRWRRGG